MLIHTGSAQSIYRRHKVFLFVGFVVVLLFCACCWDPGELSPAAGVNTYHIMHSPCNTIPLSLSCRKITNYVAGSSRDWVVLVWLVALHVIHIVIRICLRTKLNVGHSADRYACATVHDQLQIIKETCKWHKGGTFIRFFIQSDYSSIELS